VGGYQQAKCCGKVSASQVLWEGICKPGAVGGYQQARCCGKVSASQVLWEGICKPVAVGGYQQARCCGRATSWYHVQILWLQDGVGLYQESRI